MLELVIEKNCFLVVDDEVFSFLTFDGEMDVSHVPDRLQFRMGGEPDLEPIPGNVAWDGLHDLHFTNHIGDGLPFVLDIEYLGGDPDFKTARGKVVKPFTVSGIPVCPAKMTQTRRDKLLTLFPGSVALKNWSP